MNNNTLKIVALVVVAITAVLLLNSAFSVHQTQHALVLRFGEARRSISQPGLYFKLPFIENVVTIDKRVLDFDSRATPLEVIAKDQKRIVVDSFTRYRVENPLRFYQTMNSVSGAQVRLSSIVDSSVRGKLADADFLTLVKLERAKLQSEITMDVARQVEGFGIKIIDVRIRRTDLPEQNTEAVFLRMKTERVREATDIRARGNEEAVGIRAKADREVAKVRGVANQKAEEIRGRADAERNRIFAEVFNRDPDFFAFYRSMQAYEAGLRAGDTRMILSPESDFFRYFADPFGRRSGDKSEVPKN